VTPFSEANLPEKTLKPAAGGPSAKVVRIACIGLAQAQTMSATEQGTLGLF